MKLLEVKETLKKPKNKSLIQDGLEYESQLRIFTESLTSKQLGHEIAWLKYNRWLKSILTDKKYKRLKQFFRFPLSVVDISETTTNDLNKVFYANNSYFNIVSEQDTKKLQQKVDELNIEHFIIENGKDVIKNRPNTFVVLDRDKNGDEYFLTIENDRLKDFHIDKKGIVKYLCFHHSTIKIEEENHDLWAFYCDEYYRIFLEKDGEFYIYENLEIPHNYGQCPAKMFMSKNITSNDFFNKKIPFTSVLSKLEEWQTFDLYRFYVDHYGPFPIMERVEEKCTIEGCNNGFIEREETYFEDEVRRQRTIYKECPNCASKSMLGPGTVITVPSKSDKDDPDGSGIFRMISPTVDNLEYINNKLKGLETYIEMKTVGVNSAIEKQAVNEKQIEGTFETKENILIDLKTNFDQIYKWMVSILSKSVYGKESEIFVHADFGTEFYLQSESDIQNSFEQGRKIGLPATEIDHVYKQLVETKYKTNPETIARMKIITYLDSCPYDNFEIKLKKFQNGLITEQEFFISVHILNYVDRFEMENGDLVSFGKKLPLYKKIENILTTFKLYADEQIKAKQLPTGSEPNEET